MTRPIGRVAAGLLLVLLGLAALAGPLAAPAAAHAVVVASNPTAGQVLTEPPTTVTVQFSERVSAELGGISVLDADGEQVDRDGGLAPSGDVLATTLPDDLPDGTYVVNYRVVSADGHPVSGAIVFGIGESTVIDEAGVAALTAGGDPPFEIAAAIARFIIYVAALLAGGMAIFLAFVHDQTEDRWQLTPIVRFACLVGGLATVVNIGLQAALLTGDGLSAMTDITTLRGALDEGLGWQSILLLVGLATVHLSTDTERLLVAQVLAFYGSMTAAVAFVFWGHARQAPDAAISVVADGLHLVTAMVWFGGLVALGMLLRSRLRAQTPGVVSTAAMVSRFSSLAAVSVAVLLAAGVVMTWQEVGSRDAFTSTTYGRVLLAKIVVALLVLAVAAYNRYRLVPDIEDEAAEQLDAAGFDETGDYETDAGGVTRAEPASAGTLTTALRADAPPSAPAWSRLATAVRVESLGLLVVLALTSVLVVVTPARDNTTSARVFNQTLPAGDLDVNLVVTPAAAGLNVLHMQYLDGTGRPIDTPQLLETELELPDQGVGPIRQPALRAGPGHFILDDANLPIAGTWNVTLVARVSDFDQERTTFQVRVAP
jgi:copper transport protein